MTKNVFKKIAALVIMAVMVVTTMPTVSMAVTAKADETSHNAKIEAAIKKATTTKVKDFDITYYDSGCMNVDYDDNFEDNFTILHCNVHDQDYMTYQMQIKPVAKVHHKKDLNKNYYISSITKLTGQKSKSYISSTNMSPEFYDIKLKNNLIYSVKMRRKVTYNGQTSYSPWTKTEYVLYSKGDNLSTSNKYSSDFRAKRLKNGKVKLTIRSNAQGWKNGKFYSDFYYPSITIKA